MQEGYDIIMDVLAQSDLLYHVQVCLGSKNQVAGQV